MLDRLYIEISNICNLQCSFCPEVERDKNVMSPSDFEKILIQALTQAKQICLHLMGEPTAHPQFDQIIKLCEKYEAKVILTTNGTLLKRHQELLASKSISQINFSVHSFRDNFSDKELHSYLLPILEFSRELHQRNPETYINYRLWNLGANDLAEKANDDVYDLVERYFDVKINRRQGSGRFKSKKIWNRVYFHFDSRFEWPSPDRPLISENGTCHALSSHAAIHADGTVVACCLDKEARLDLGNAHKQSLSEIFNSERATKMRQGFSKGELVEDLCRRCDYITRFKSKTKRLRQNA